MNEEESLLFSTNRILFQISRPGELHPYKCFWFAFHKCWMYGPCETIEEVLIDLYENWQSDSHIVG